MPQVRLGNPLQDHSTTYEQWNSLTVLDQRRLLYSLLLGLIMALFVSAFVVQINKDSLPMGTPSWSEFTLVLIVLVIGHETLHLAAFPRLGLDSNSIIGIWPEMGSPYVQYLLPMQRNRFILVLTFPFIVLTLLPLFLITVKIGSIPHLSWIAVLNSIGAGSDILISIKLLYFVPSNSLVIENGEKICWSFTAEK